MVAFDTRLEGYTRAQLLLKEGVEVVCGGFPCQDISAAGKGLGLAGSRSGLWREQLRTIRLVRPIYAIVENVAMLLNRGMGTVLADLAESGYDTEWGCISACDVGAPHLRERIWIVAHTEQPGRQYGKKRDKKTERHPRTHANDSLSQGVIAHSDGEGQSQLQGMQQDQRGWNNNETQKNMLPTIGANEGKGSSRDRFKGSPNFHGAKMSEGLRTTSDDPIYLNPCFAEVVMGFPQDYTALEMQSYQQSQELSENV